MVDLALDARLRTRSLFVSDVRLVATETFVQRMRFLGQDLLAIVRSALPLFITVLVCLTYWRGRHE